MLTSTRIRNMWLKYILSVLSIRRRWRPKTSSTSTTKSTSLRWSSTSFFTKSRSSRWRQPRMLQLCKIRKDNSSREHQWQRTQIWRMEREIRRLMLRRRQFWHLKILKHLLEHSAIQYLFIWHMHPNSDPMLELFSSVDLRTNPSRAKARNRLSLATKITMHLYRILTRSLETRIRGSRRKKM